MRLLTIAAVAAIPAVAWPAEVISGAFGFVFGQALDSDAYVAKRSEPDGGTEYEFVPTSPYGRLTVYTVFATPKTHIVYKIIAKGQFKSATECGVELSNVEQALSQRYGENSGNDIVAAVSGIRTIRFGNAPRRIVGVCFGVLSEHELTLSYMDDVLTDKARLERAELLNSSRDTSGL